MGVPKFFRYMSGKYPCLCEILKEHQIPQYDNLYLDVNGILHTCSHTNDSEVQLHASEEDIFKAIFHYIEVLFRMIQPQKLFFMAIDGVAPRAKMNQQRGRRFRNAKVAELAAAKAKAEGTDIPIEQKFDSNCITPGTEFMAKLSDQLRAFIINKVNTEPLWQKCKVLYSGPEVPGEGEHKIMDYIRYMRTKPNQYDPNGSHCLYGLDADLIMLGLCTHEVHFSLLREEIKFGKNMNYIAPGETKFCLLHLSLLREYINLEFSPLKDKLSFSYDLEKIIDDWVLMGFLVGNDFIPHLPNLHIINGALTTLYHTYMEVLPTLDGYINEAGSLRLDRFEKFMEKLGRLDVKEFNEYYADLKCFEGKVGERLKRKNKQNRYCATVEEQEKDLPEGVFKFPTHLSSLSYCEDESRDDESENDTYSMEFVQHKRDYYMNKLKYEKVDEAVIRSQAEVYVRAIQWTLHYYYNGCCSWSWYYPHHYAPCISDIKDFKDLKLEFELGEPFLPFEQLLATLPAFSRQLLPVAFQSLLTDEQSPIIDYYPVDFKVDLNGKTDEWEAVVLIPMIDEKRLLDAMKPHYSKLKPEEVNRNKHGPMSLYVHLKPGNASRGNVRCCKIMREDIIIPREKLIKGLHANTRLDIYHPGIPTFRYIDFTASLRQEKVKSFQQHMKECMILDRLPVDPPNLKTLALDILGKQVYVSWPYLIKAQVVAVSNFERKITIINPLISNCENNLCERKVKGIFRVQWKLQAKHIAESYKTCFGINIGETYVLIHARLLVGRKYIFRSHGKFYLEPQWSDVSQSYAYQMVVKDDMVHTLNATICKTADEIFKRKTVCFMLGHPHYGAMGEVIEVEDNGKSMRVKVLVEVSPGPSLDALRKIQSECKTQYMYAHKAAQRLGISPHLLSIITGTLMVTRGSPDQEKTKHNIGLNLKFNKKNAEIPGYTRKENCQWLYSAKVVKLVRDYMDKFPELFEKLTKDLVFEDLHEDDLFSKESLELGMVLDWLKEQEYRSVDSCPRGADVLDVEMVQRIEKELDAYCKKQDEISKFVLMQVKPHLLFTPGLHIRHTWPDTTAKTILLDRICCVCEHFTVPLGSKGIVVGIYKAEVATDTMYDIIFDTPFAGGLTLNGSSKNRAYRLSMADFINVSYGERMQQAMTGLSHATPESHDTLKQTSNYKNQSYMNATSAFASFNAESSPSQAPTVVLSNAQVTKTAVRKANGKGSPQDTEPVQNPLKNVRSEFQALWNDLHKLEQKTVANQEKVINNPTGTKTKQVSATIGENLSDDPSAFLKAVLKITGGGAQSTAGTIASSTTPNKATSKTSEQKKSDAPPLVEQLFDQARKNEKKKDDKRSIWHCSQLLNYYLLSRMGMPQYRYLTDLQSNLVRAQILLPDTRVFTGDLCATHDQAAESAAKKVYHELNLDKGPKPDMNILLPPRQWYNNRQNNCWESIRPPTHMMPICSPKFNQNPQMPMMHFPQWNPNIQQNPGFPPMALQHGSQGKQLQPKLHHIESKPDVKNTTSFVPLQAQKKSRDATVKQAAQEQSQSVEAGSQVTVQQKKEQKKDQKLASKMLNVENTRVESLRGDKKPSTQSTVQQSPKLEIPAKPRRSRVAAKFGPPPAVNGGESQ